MPRGRKKDSDIESTFYDVFSSWAEADREIALKVLHRLHDHLPSAPKGTRSATAKTEDDPETNAQGALIP